VSDLREELEAEPLVTAPHILDLQAPAPQLSFPFRLGIAAPIVHQSSNTELEGFSQETRDVWRENEEKVIETWCERFRDEGLVSDVAFLPRLLMLEDPKTNPSLLARARAAAARQGVDAVLVTRSVSSIGSRLSPLVILDFTIVTGFLLPSHTVECHTVMEAVLVDTRNGYVYLVGRGEGEKVRSSALFLMEEKVDGLAEQSHLAALEDLAADMLDQTARAGFHALRHTGMSRGCP
jgi:hypothetical protein